MVNHCINFPAAFFRTLAVLQQNCEKIKSKMLLFRIEFDFQKLRVNNFIICHISSKWIKMFSNLLNCWASLTVAVNNRVLFDWRMIFQFFFLENYLWGESKFIDHCSHSSEFICFCVREMTTMASMWWAFGCAHSRAYKIWVWKHFIRYNKHFCWLDRRCRWICHSICELAMKWEYVQLLIGYSTLTLQMDQFFFIPKPKSNYVHKFCNPIFLSFSHTTALARSRNQLVLDETILHYFYIHLTQSKVLTL